MSYKGFKRFLRNILILLMYSSGLPLLRNWILQKRGYTLTRVLVFHQVKDDKLHLFRKKLRYLKSNFNIISLDDYFGGNLSKKEINIALTFDDGYLNWKKNVIPILRKLNLPATFFICSGFVNNSVDEAPKFAEKHKINIAKSLSWKDIKAFWKSGFCIGGHTVNHTDLGEVFKDNSDMTTFFQEEVSCDKRQIEGEIDAPIKYFAYPFGGTNNICPQASEIVQKAGYEAAFTIVPNFNFINSNNFYLHRDCVDELSLPIFRAWVFGSYDYIKMLIDTFRALK